MKIFSLLLMLLCGDVLFAQMTYRFNNYSINEGLSQSSVTCIVQDKTNALWVGTQDGLNRFDGKNFEIFNSDVTEGLENEYIHCSHTSADGNLWFGTANGLVKYDFENETFKTFTISKAIPLQIEQIVEDSEGNFWMASLTSGLLRFNTKTESITHIDGILPSEKVLHVSFNERGILLINTEDQGIFEYDLKRKTLEKLAIPYRSATQGVVLNLVSPDAQHMYICTSLGVFEYQIDTKKLIQKFLKLEKEFGKISVQDLYLTKNNNWLIASTNHGLFTIKEDGYIFNSSEDIFQKYALINNKINAIYKDSHGTFWIGTDRGLSSFDPLNQGFLGVGPTGNLEHGIPTPSVWAFGEDEAAETIFIGTDKGISKYDRKTRKFEHFYKGQEKKLVSNNDFVVLSLNVINKKQLLVGTSKGLLQLDIEQGGGYSFRNIDLDGSNENQQHARVYSIVKWKDDTYFLGTNGGVVALNLKTKKTLFFEHDSKRKDQTISSGICRLIFKDKQGVFWFGTSTGGLNILQELQGEVRIVPHSMNAQLLQASKNYITSIYQQNKNQFWIGTFGSGLMSWNVTSKEIKLFDKQKGLPNNVIYGVLSTDNKKLWCSTNKGICCFDMETHKIVNYKEENGLMSNEFNMGSFFKSKTGELYFGGISGYNFFNPQALVPKKNEINILFRKLKVDKNWVKPNESSSPLTAPLYLTQNLELDYLQRNLTFQFIASDLSNPDLINYKYRLEGTDDGEIFLGNVTEIRLSALSPGDYTLKVYARIGEGEWCKKPATMHISIAYPFWGKWWFWVGIGIILLLLVRIFVRRKIELERRKLVRLEMKIAERTSEIRAKNSQIEEQNQIINLEKNKVIEQKRLLQIEKDKSENLIRKIIPESTVEELKNSGKTSARAYKMVSILFTDFVGFTKIAERMTPTDLVNKLDIYFRKFDEIIVNNNLEKIKTIGDAYMCAGGVPVRNNTNPIDTCLAALQIQDYMAALKREAIEKDEEYWSLRLGINTGEVTAGVIGSERLAYDIWGSAVNRAQRMEMLGEPGKVTITGETYKLIEPYFECVFKGKAQSKSKNEIDMYSVERIKPQLSLREEGIYPNDRFQQVVNLYLYSSINYNKAERHITRVLKKGLSEKLHYHCLEHVTDVVQAVENLALTENVTDEGLFLLKSAASYHDAGFIEQYEKNEPIGARLAEEILPKYGYTDQHIEIIKELIYVTQIPHKPKNKLEEIMCDADLDYLGRDDFHEIADRLRIELREHGKIDSDRKWDELQVQFLTNHRYFTKTAVATRRAKKLQNLEEIKERLLRNEYKD